MLVLTRKLMEKLYIGDDICVTVVRLEGGQVRLGIEAPREIAVVRAELLSERNPAIQNATVHPPMGLRTGPEVRSRSVGPHGIGSRRPGRSQ
jgi:carbon storage regulator